MHKSLVLVLPAIMAVIFSLPSLARPLTPTEKARVREAVTENFNDPDAARFRWLPLPNVSPKTLMYCAVVNGRDKFGAYTGYQPFIVGLQFEGKTATLAVPVKIAGNEDEAWAVKEYCLQRGQDVREAK